MIISLSKKTKFDTSDAQQREQLLERIKKLNKEELAAIKIQIEQATIVTFDDFDIYKAVQKKPFKLCDFEYRYFESDRVLAGCNAYTFITDRFIALPNVKKENYYPYALITKLLYEYQRHPWDKEPCVTIRRVIEKFLPETFRCSIDYFQNLLEKKEKNEHTHFGDYLSDDSDSDAEENFKNLPKVDQAKKNTKSKTWRDRAGYIKYINCVSLLKKPPAPNFKTRPAIYRDRKFKRRQANEDLKLLNQSISEGNFKPELLNTLQTKFVVAQYRGIHYFQNNFDITTRREHRELDEVGKPQFTSAVIHQAGIKSYREYLDKIKNDPEFHKTLLAIGEQVQALLLEMQETDPVVWNGYAYLNLFYLFQYWYSSDYDSLPNRLAADLAKPDSHFKDFVLNTYRSLLSTGDIPYHALKYAYGIKVYKGHEHERLRPQWQLDGTAERPYSGKAYVSLHPITDYIEGNPSHLTSLFKEGLCPLTNLISGERETSFLGYLAGDRIAYQMVAKYPSFKKDYKTIYEYKYGITKPLFIKIRNAFQKNPPHSDERKMLKLVLGEYLCAYQEVRLIDKANRKAQKQGATLIYRDEDGEFSLYHPETPTTANKRLGAIVSTKRELYRAIAPSKSLVVKKMTSDKFERGVEKITYIQENLDKLREIVTLDELKELSLDRLKLLNCDALLDMIADEEINWEVLAELPDEKLEIICKSEIVNLIADNPELFNTLIAFPDEKFALLENEQLLELLDERKVTIDEIDTLDEVDVESILDYDNLKKPLSEGYKIAKLVKKFAVDPMHLTCLTCDDLEDLVVDLAPDVPDLVMKYAHENGVKFSLVKKQLGKSERLLFDQTVDNYFHDQAESESNIGLGY